MSVRYTVCFARRAGHEPDRAFLETEDLNRLLETPPEQFVQVYYDDYNALNYGDLQGMVEDYAARIGEAIGIAVQENVEHLAYAHAKPGQLLRGLAYNSDCGWYQVHGTPEPWEQALMFTDQRRENLLADYGDDPDSVAAIQAVWASGQLQQGSYFPSVWAAYIAYDICAHQHLDVVGA